MDTSRLKELKILLKTFDDASIDDFLKLMYDLDQDFASMPMLSVQMIQNIVSLVFNMLLLLTTKCSEQDEQTIFSVLNGYFSTAENSLKDYNFNAVHRSFEAIHLSLHNHFRRFVRWSSIRGTELCAGMKESLQRTKRDLSIKASIILRVDLLITNIEIALLTEAQEEADTEALSARFEQMRTHDTAHSWDHSMADVRPRQRSHTHGALLKKAASRSRDLLSTHRRDSDLSSEYDDDDGLRDFVMLDNESARNERFKRSQESGLSYSTDTVTPAARHGKAHHSVDPIQKLLSEKPTAREELKPSTFGDHFDKVHDVVNGPQCMLVMYVCAMYLSREPGSKPIKECVDMVVSQSFRSRSWISISCELEKDQVYDPWLKAIFTLIRTCMDVDETEMKKVLKASYVYNLLDLEKRTGEYFDIESNKGPVRSELSRKLREFDDPQNSRSRLAVAQKEQALPLDDFSRAPEASVGSAMDDDKDTALVNTKLEFKNMLLLFFIFGRKRDKPYMDLKTAAQLDVIMKEAELDYERIITKRAYQTGAARLNDLLSMLMRFAYVICQTKKKSHLKSALYFSIEAMRCYIMHKESKQAGTFNDMIEIYIDEIQQIGSLSIVQVAERCQELRRKNKSMQSNEGLMILQIICMQAIEYAFYKKFFKCDFVKVVAPVAESKQEWV